MRENSLSQQTLLKQLNSHKYLKMRNRSKQKHRMIKLEAFKGENLDDLRSGDGTANTTPKV